jgi:antitoxin component of MazEF toxin-antitoxin module
MQTIEATLSTWGKSTALRIPAAIVRSCSLKAGQTVRISSNGSGNISIQPVLLRPNLDALLAGVTDANLPDHGDITWGKAQGTEAW